MKITFFEAAVEKAKTLEDLYKDMDVTFVPGILSAETVGQASEAEVISIFVGSMLTSELLERMPHLQHVVSRSTGVDHIDKAVLVKRDITLSNVPSYGSVAVAEHAFALLLSLSRRTFEAHDQIQEEGNFEVTRLQGFDLFGKTFGVIGTGRIGKNSARIGKGFGMKILLNDKFPDDKFAAEVSGTYVSLDELLARSDVLTLHCPYLPENRHMIGEAQFAKMKSGMTLINTARGELMDTIALVRALESGIVAHVGLDVLEGERNLKDEAELVLGDHKIDELKTIIADHVLIDDPRVLITPHIAFHSREADRERVTTATKNIIAYAEGREENVVKLD
ncbi:MAG TPA: NAD(P)-dependent oxidoreductase [Candidatus Paceibacterota bacterium]